MTEQMPEFTQTKFPARTSEQRITPRRATHSINSCYIIYLISIFLYLPNLPNWSSPEVSVKQLTVTWCSKLYKHLPTELSILLPFDTLAKNVQMQMSSAKGKAPITILRMMAAESKVLPVHCGWEGTWSTPWDNLSLSKRQLQMLCHARILT